MIEQTVFDIWKMTYPSLADCILLIFCVCMFFWFRSSDRNRAKQLVTMITENSLKVKEHFDEYNKTHEKSWTTLAELVQELKIGKVWQNEYNIQIDNIKERNDLSCERIRDLEERIKVIERERRVADN